MVEKQIAHKLLSKVSSGGLKVTYWDGSSETYGPAPPYLHITIKSPKVFWNVVTKLSVGFGESYMRGDIEVEGPLDQLIRLGAENKKTFGGIAKLKAVRRFRKYESNHRSGQKEQIAHHYDIGNDFYKLWLDSSMTYSCAYFKKPSDTIDQAQHQKIEHILHKLQLKEGQTLLDIGSGWGSLAIEAAKQYGVKALGITLSEEQAKFSRAAAKRAGVEKLVTFKLTNYQDLAEGNERFDRIVSVGMFEHVGRENQKEYFKAVHTLLKDGGLSVLHSISHDYEKAIDPWIRKYIFPGGYIPSIRQVVDALPEYDFHLIDYENLRIHYAMTLGEWRKRFNSKREIVKNMFDEQFCRMWDLYLATSSGGFRYGDLSLSQFVFTKGLNNDLPLTREFLYKNPK